MRFMVLVKANEDTEAGVMPSEELLTEMGKFNEELVKAGVMLAGEGLHPSSKGARVRFSGRERTVIDAPQQAHRSLPESRYFEASSDGGRPHTWPAVPRRYTAPAASSRRCAAFQRSSETILQCGAGVRTTSWSGRFSHVRCPQASDCFVAL